MGGNRSERSVHISHLSQLRSQEMQYKDGLTVFRKWIEHRCGSGFYVTMWTFLANYEKIHQQYKINQKQVTVYFTVPCCWRVNTEWVNNFDSLQVVRCVVFFAINFLLHFVKIYTNMQKRDKNRTKLKWRTVASSNVWMCYNCRTVNKKLKHEHDYF